MVSHVLSGSVIGVEGYFVEVEVDIQTQIPGFVIVGLPEGAVKESKERVMSAIKNSGYKIPPRKIIVNLAPADIKKEGALFDLPIAIGILRATGYIHNDRKIVVIGELSLDGRIKHARGILPIASAVKTQDARDMLVPMENGKEAAMVEGINVYTSETLDEAVHFLNGELEKQPVHVDRESFFEVSSAYNVDFSEVKGQEHVKRALEVAAAGGHNILMIGPPGSGKTMLARRLPTILPGITLSEAIETTKIHSVAGFLRSDEAIIGTRPFRSPHHTISNAGLIGGGSIPRPGEVSLAHNGVLFLDELPEFSQKVIEVLRQPLEDGHVTISRAKLSITYPARFMLVAAMNPCPCGYLTDPYHKCTCTPSEIKRYHSRISGPLLDRIDIHVEVPAVRYEDLKKKKEGEPSSVVRSRVEKARAIQLNRFNTEQGVYFNAHMQQRHIKKYCKVDEQSENILKIAVEKLGLSARAYHRVLKVARTIADLEGVDDIQTYHVQEAIQYRTLDRENWFMQKITF